MAIIQHYWNNIFSILKELTSITDESAKKEAAERLAGLLVGEYTRDVSSIANSFIEIGCDVRAYNVPRSVVDSLKEAIFCYVNEQYLSTIASVGITAELFCVYLYELYLYQQGLERSLAKRRLEKFGRISQDEKIDTLFSVAGLDEHICGVLHQIKKKRNDNIHPSIGRDYKEDALDCLQNMIDLLNIYSASIINGEQSSLPALINENDPFIGKADAPVTVLEFFDYQCPFCRKFWKETLPLLKKDYVDTGKVKFVVRDFPLEFHPSANIAARAAEFVLQNYGLEAHWKMYEKIFEEQSIKDSGLAGGQVTRAVDFNEADLVRWAKEIGFDITNFLKETDVAEEVQEDIIDAQVSKITGTPHFFINEIPLTGSQPYSVFKEIIDAELAK